MEPVFIRYASGISALLAGGYSVIGSTGGFTRVLTEEVMLVLGGVAIIYGIALVANKQASLAGAGGIGLVGVAGLMILTQLLYDPTPAFADGGVWNDSPGTQLWMYVLAGLLAFCGFIQLWERRQDSSRMTSLLRDTNR